MPIPNEPEKFDHSNELPLFDLFNTLRQAGIPLGIDDYQAVLRAMQAGFGLGSREALAHLCRTLWIKSEDDFPLFVYYFERALSKANRQTEVEDKDTSAPPTAPPSIKDETTSSAPTAQDKSTTSPSKTSNKTVSETETESPGSNLLDREPATTETPHDIDVDMETVEKEEIPKTVLWGMDETPFADRQTAARILLKAAYFELTEREMKQGWRYLRRMVRQGTPTELDVTETVKQAAREGFVNPVLRPRRINKASLIFLVDRLGSMLPFHMLGDQLVKSLQEVGRLSRTQIYYFHDVPPKQPGQSFIRWYPEYLLFRQKTIIDALLLNDIVANFNPRQTAVLIFSDAGAARGKTEDNRVEETARFLAKLAQLDLQYVAWLNPMPQTRWQNTTAEKIARLTPMMPTTRQGFYQAIDVLRGRHIEQV